MAANRAARLQIRFRRTEVTYFNCDWGARCLILFAQDAVESSSIRPGALEPFLMCLQDAIQLPFGYLPRLRLPVPHSFSAVAGSEKLPFLESFNR